MVLFRCKFTNTTNLWRKIDFLNLEKPSFETGILIYLILKKEKNNLFQIELCDIFIVFGASCVKINAKAYFDILEILNCVRIIYFLTFTRSIT